MSGTKGRSGGVRVGAGRKPMGSAARFLSGGRDRRGAGKPKRGAVDGVLPQVEPPQTLTAAELKVWHATVAEAIAARTLTPGTADDFGDLCSLVVEMRAVLEERREEGWTTRGTFLAKEYRGLVQRVEAKRRAFRLAPIGREMVPVEQPEDEWAEFDKGFAVLPGGRK